MALEHRLGKNSVAALAALFKALSPEPHSRAGAALSLDNRGHVPEVQACCQLDGVHAVS
jgi:hypothetical protein